MDIDAPELAGQSVYLKFINSLDTAFMARRGMGNCCSDAWGEQFFTSLDEAHRLAADQITLMYAAASRLLNQFALRQEMEEYAWVFYRNPKSFAKTIMAMVENGLLP
jgi:hypothetical protein